MCYCVGFLQEEKICLPYKTSREALLPLRSPLQWLPDDLVLESGVWGVKLITYSLLVSRLCVTATESPHSTCLYAVLSSSFTVTLLLLGGNNSSRY
jgi:hypothetical protein